MHSFQKVVNSFASKLFIKKRIFLLFSLDISSKISILIYVRVEFFERFRRRSQKSEIMGCEMKPQYMTTIERDEIQPFYWNTNVKSIDLFTFGSPYLKKEILKKDPECKSLRFGVLPNGCVLWWNGSVNHTGVCNWIHQYWILTGIWKFDDDKFTSNNKYSFKQLEKMKENDSEFQITTSNWASSSQKDIDGHSCPI